MNRTKFKIMAAGRKCRAILEILRTKRFMLVGIRPKNDCIEVFTIGCMPKGIAEKIEDTVDDIMIDLNRKIEEEE